MKIIIDKLSIKYNEIYGVRDITCTLEGGKFISLIGHNGSGKSTLCNSIVGILEPSLGEVQIDALSIEDKLFSNIGFSPQDQIVDWYSNVYNNIVLGAELAKLSKKETEKNMSEILQLLNLESLKFKNLTELSGGQLQRVQIARALIHKPSIYILDEPTVGLDAQNTDRLMQYLKKEAKKGKLVLVSSHDLYLLQEYSDEVVLLDNSSLLYHGSMKDLLNAKKESRQLILEISQDNICKDELFNIKDGIINFELTNNTELLIELENRISVTALLKMLNEDIEVLNIKEKEKTLKEVYLSMSKENSYEAD
ncbi:ABC transporter ATP-binding protein [Aerococcaceae bacterium zg-ZJ1578]|uniref:ABC transporter ATP-binding protein n=1 Tax=Aerococcaceae bacterium zg-252 TaxID=2796928 RepID=UPI001A348C28|nr:ABC transporter ATP-binding protein [Aerococcaceae bacterium zg-1578]